MLRASRVDPRQPGFDCLAALDCAHASALAYVAETHPTEATDLARKWGLTRYEAPPADPHFAVFLGASDSLILAFRGTTKCVHWRTNLDIAWKRTPWGRVHRGFWEATHRFWPELPRLIKALSHERPHFSITGHSLGGAIAVLTSAMLEWEHDVGASAVISFGQPPVGFRRFNAEFTRRLGLKYVRFVHDVDGVSGIPQLLYSHITPPMYFDISDKLWNGKPVWQSTKDHVKAPGKYGGPEIIKTHGMRHYVEALEGFTNQVRGLPRDMVDGGIHPV